ncbi:hypothetical protein [Burkholderia gladioli]|uniref:hypothetical protein n=1 Tax=Burkholderia gladioli TaxID=28095 RepID=UPI00163E9C0D|nr:hypothetical protein [Burkholderia gladioli]
MGVIVGTKLNGKGMARNVAAMAIAMSVVSWFVIVTKGLANRRDVRQAPAAPVASKRVGAAA